MNTEINFTVPTGNTYGINIPTAQLNDVFPYAWLNHDTPVPNFVDLEDTNAWRSAMVASTAAAQFEYRFQSAPNANARPVPDDKANSFVANVESDIPEQFTLNDFAEEFGYYVQNMAMALTPALQEFHDSVARAHIDHASLIYVDGYKAKGTSAVNPADRTFSYASTVCLAIDSGLINETRLFLMYSKLRSTGQTPDEIAGQISSVLKEAV